MKKIIIGLGTLAVVGVATGIIVAVKIGKAKREELKDGAIETIDHVNDAVQAKADAFKDSANDAAKKIKKDLKTTEKAATDTK